MSLSFFTVYYIYIYIYKGWLKCSYDDIIYAIDDAFFCKFNAGTAILMKDCVERKMGYV